MLQVFESFTMNAFCITESPLGLSSGAPTVCVGVRSQWAKAYYIKDHCESIEADTSRLLVAPALLQYSSNIKDRVNATVHSTANLSLSLKSITLLSPAPQPPFAPTLRRQG